MSRPTRTFVALPIPEDRAEKLARLQSLIAPDLPGARWVGPGMFHVTLAYLGDVPDADLVGVCRAVSEAAASHPPLSLVLAGLGVFPDPERPRVAWVGLKGDDLERLAGLRKAVVSAVASAGYPPEDDRFTPHVTLGRLKPGRGPSADASPLLRHYERWSAGHATFSEVVTYASQLAPEGPAYVPLGRAPLKGR